MQALKELELIDLRLVRDLSVPSLEKLVLIKMSSLERCSGLTAPPLLPSQEVQEVCLSSLHRIVIHDCPSLIVSRRLPPSACIWRTKISIRGKLSINIDRVALKIESSGLSVLDDQILAFHNLRGIGLLTIKNCSKLVSISSDGFSQLTSLEYFSICNCPNLLKPSITLEAASETIPTLPSLKYLNISSSGIAGGWLTKMLPHLRSLEELSLHDCPQIKWLSIGQPAEPDGSSSLVSAVALSAEDQTLLKVPSNILCSLKQLTISGCVDLEFYGGMRGFGGCTTLEMLQIDDCLKLGSLLVSGTKDNGTSNMDVALLPPSLKKLSISGCPKLVSLLVRDTKDDTSNVDVWLLSPSLEVLSLSHLPEHLQSYFLKGLAYLKILSLTWSPALKRVQLHSCKALEELTILKCEQLGALEGLKFLTSLRRLIIEMNPELSAAWGRDRKVQEQEQGANQIGLLTLSIKKLEISNLTNNVQSCLLSCLPAITQLAVLESPELTFLHLGHCTTLTELKIRHCESLVSIEGFRSITNLTSFKVAVSSSLPPWMELLLQQQGVCVVLSRLTELEIGDSSILTMPFCKQLTSLRCLEFDGDETSPMVSLTEEQERALQLLTSLQELKFRDYPNLQLLPANLRSLVSLKVLGIWSCPIISELPELDISCRLEVDDCSEELSQRCKEWQLRRREFFFRECLRAAGGHLM
jgi:hypothetical protein